MKLTRRDNTMGRVLVVDDHASVRESVIDILRQAGYAVDGLASAVEALPLVERHTPDVVITDLQMPGIDGLEFIRQISRRRLPTQVIMITAHATIASAVEAMRFGPPGEDPSLLIYYSTTQLVEGLARHEGCRLSARPIGPRLAGRPVGPRLADPVLPLSTVATATATTTAAA